MTSNSSALEGGGEEGEEEEEEEEKEEKVYEGQTSQNQIGISWHGIAMGLGKKSRLYRNLNCNQLETEKQIVELNRNKYKAVVNKKWKMILN